MENVDSSVVMGLRPCENELYPARIGIVAFMDKPIPRESYVACLFEPVGLYGAFVSIALIPVIAKLNWTIRSDFGIDNIPNVHWATFNRVANEGVFHICNPIFRFC